MEKQIFINQIQRLKQTYGDKAFSDERVELMWEWAKHERSEILRTSVDEILETQMSAPSPAKIKQTVLEISKYMGGGEDRVTRFAKIHDWCERCGKTGTVTAVDEQRRVFAFQCVCPMGKIAAPSFKKWSPELSKKYKRDSHGAAEGSYPFPLK